MFVGIAVVGTAAVGTAAASPRLLRLDRPDGLSPISTSVTRSDSSWLQFLPIDIIITTRAVFVIQTSEGDTKSGGLGDGSPPVGCEAPVRVLGR